ncbi:MAG: PRC and DUF2382 domain-containing protein [Actinobacteria bacterium]|nr:PRC and DUF2382 domain-containing protein [Actinomycetota bacterium]
MTNTVTMDQLDDARGASVYDSTGEEIGKLEEIFYDEQTGKPEWIGIGTGFFGTKRVLVPVKGGELSADGFRVPYEKDQVKESPDIDSDKISQETEQELYSYYGLDYSERRSDTGLPEGSPGRVDRGMESDDDASVTRSEEELRVGKRAAETGRVRLRKWVETTPVSEEVEVRRETARVEREPIDQPVSGAEIGEDEVEVSLTAEEAVVDKQTVAKERVSIDKEIETDREVVQDELRKERVEVEGDNVEERG